MIVASLVPDEKVQLAIGGADSVGEKSWYDWSLKRRRSLDPNSSI